LKQPGKEYWWTRNWKWFVPLGCLGAVILVVAFFVVIIFTVFGFMKSSNVYKEAVANAKANISVVEVLELQIEEGLFVSGKPACSF
jgi:uncharacterized membrane protein YbaN (DUF454 family)